MSADGISVPTTLSQMGNVAKTQARAQPNTQQVTPFGEQQDKKDELKVQRVKETKHAEQERIDPDQERRDKRQRRRKRRQLKLRDRETGTEAEGREGEPENEQQQGELETLGSRIDLRV